MGHALRDAIPALAGLVLAAPAGALFATIVGCADRTGWRLAYDEVALATLVALVTPLIYAHHLRRLRFWWQAPRLHDTEVEPVQRR